MTHLERVREDIDRATRELRWPDRAYPCANPACERLVGRALYCCAGCRMAHEGGYEIHEDGYLGHSVECSARHEKAGTK